MLTAILQFLISAAIIVIAGTTLTRFADKISDLTGLGRVLVGSIFLAAATSLPELSVDISAVRQGHVDLAAGDLVGSSLFNLLILAILDLLHYSRGQMLSRTAAAHALSATIGIVLTSLVALAILLGKSVQQFAVAGIGPGSWVILVGYLLGVRMIFYDQRISAQIAGLEAEVPSDEETRKASLKKAVFGYVAAAAVIVIAAPYLADAAGTIAEYSGLGTTFIGTTLVALCTSLPELVASLAAIRMGAFDLALGNIFGSNAFNMILFVPLDLAHQGPIMAEVSTGHVLTALAVILVTSIAILGQLYQVEKRQKFIEPDALMMIGIIFAALAGVYYLRDGIGVAG